VAVNARQANFAGAGCTSGERGQFADGGEWIASVCVALRFAFGPIAELEVFVKQLLDSADLPANSADPDHLFAEETTLARRAPHPAAGAPAGVCRRSSKRAQLECIAVGRLAAGRRCGLIPRMRVTTKAPTSPQEK